MEIEKMQRSEENSKPYSFSQSQISCIVECKPIEGTNRLQIAGHEFHWGTKDRDYNYWYCKYKRTNPKICKASFRQNIEQKSLMKEN